MSDITCNGCIDGNRVGASCKKEVALGDIALCTTKERHSSVEVVLSFCNSHAYVLRKYYPCYSPDCSKEEEVNCAD